MRAGAQAIALFAAQNEWAQCDLLTLTLVGGSPLYLTSLDQNLTVGGHTYLTCGGQSGLAGMRRTGSIRWTTGTEVSTVNLIFDTSDDNPGFASGQDLAKLAVSGGLYNATALLQRVVADTFAGLASATPFWLFNGQVVEVTVDGGSVNVTIRSDLQRLQQTVPRRTFGPACPYQFCGTACGLTAATYTTATTVAAEAGNSTKQVKIATAPADHYYKGGTITLTSGALQGVSRTILDNTGSILSFDVPLPSTPADGVTVSVMRGCRKTLATCTAYQGTPNRFPGFPLAPKGI